MNFRVVGLVLVIGITIAVSIPVYSYTWHLGFHILGALVFVGNITVSALWTVLARHTAQASVVAFASRTVSAADSLLTFPGVILVLLNGLALANKLYGWSRLHEAGWITGSLVLLALSGVVWAGFLLRYQAAMVRLSVPAAQSGGNLPPEFFAVFNRWALWSTIATALPLISLYLMVAKPRLWD